MEAQWHSSSLPSPFKRVWRKRKYSFRKLWDFGGAKPSKDGRGVQKQPRRLVVGEWGSPPSVTLLKQRATFPVNGEGKTGRSHCNA